MRPDRTGRSAGTRQRRQCPRPRPDQPGGGAGRADRGDAAARCAKRLPHHQGAYRTNRKTRAAGAEAQRGDRRKERRMNIPAKATTIDVEIHGNFVDGREVEAGSGEMLDLRNPATGDVIAKIPNSTKEDIDRAMKSARAAFEGKAWGHSLSWKGFWKGFSSQELIVPVCRR